MKRTILSAGICCLAIQSTVSAQEIKAPSTTSPKLIFGLQTGLTRENPISIANSLSQYQRGDLPVTYPSMGLFARYYMGKHLAIQVGLEGHKLNQLSYTNQYTSSNSPVVTNYTNTVDRRSFDVPVSVQYHLLDSKSKIRPYFGVGLVNRFNSSTVTETYDDNTGVSSSYIRKGTQRQGFLMFSQGVTWQLNKKWQINQSLNYMYNGFANMTNFRFGVGYTIK